MPACLLIFAEMTIAEENYIKAIYKLSTHKGASVSTNSIANEMNTTAASVTDMIKKLAEKNLVGYEKYKGVKLTNSGIEKAKSMVRKHRLWEVFLVEKLNFGWDEIHEVAEELEHINSSQLIERLDHFLGRPQFDPHGDPIPDEKGKMLVRSRKLLSKVAEGVNCQVVGVDDSSSTFLQYLNQLQIGLGTQLRVLDVIPFDGSLKLAVNNQSISISALVANNIYVAEDE